MSGSDSDSLLGDPQRIILNLIADPNELYSLLDMYQPIINWVDSDLHMFKLTERTYTDVRRYQRDNTCPRASVEIPSIGVMVFLHEEGMLGCERIQTAKNYFESPPWKFHHSEHVSRGVIQPYPYNSQDYYFTSDDLPLWAVRQVHCGKEHIRLVTFTSYENWDDMVTFYKLIIGADPDIVKNDFCLFTLHTQPCYDVQFALKKLPKDIHPKKLDSIRMQFRITDVGHIVPLFPNICQPLSDTKWQTTDHDGNTVVLDVVGSPYHDRFTHMHHKPRIDEEEEDPEDDIDDDVEPGFYV